MLSAEKRWGLSGGVTAVKGCVAAACSPGMSLEGTGRSSTRKIGRVVRVLRNRIPGPLEGAGAAIVATYLAARRVGPAVVGDGGAGDHHAVHDQRRRCDGIGVRLEGRNPQAGLEIHHPVSAEAGA